MKKKYKLYVWTDFSPDYSSGLAFALAKDETMARAMIEKEMGWTVYQWGTLTIHDLTEPLAKAVCGGG